VQYFRHLFLDEPHPADKTATVAGRSRTTETARSPASG
jgi:hypothetical protein